MVYVDARKYRTSAEMGAHLHVRVTTSCDCPSGVTTRNKHGAHRLEIIYRPDRLCGV